MSMPPPGFGPPPGPLSYAAPLPVRPGTVTAMGVASIVVGGLSALASLYGVVTGIVYLFMSSFQFPMPMPVPATMPATAPAVTLAPAAFRFQVSHGASALTIVESTLSVCAAALLIVAGAMILRDSPRADRLHRIYIAIKIPLIIAGGFATWWIYIGLMS